MITERTGVEPKVFLAKLAEFVAKEVTQTVIDQDLNMLLPPDKFHQIRKVLLPETLNWLNQEARK